MIDNILENKEVGEAIPILIADVVKVKKYVEEDGSSKQNIIVKDKKGSGIRILIKDKAELKDDITGKSFSFESAANAKGLIDGLTLKKTSSDECFILMSKVGKMIPIKDVEEEKPKSKPVEEAQQEEEQEEEFPADKTIDRIFKEREYIYQRILKLNESYEGSYPSDKLPELATSIHITLERQSIDVFPKVRKPKVPPQSKQEDKKQSSSIDWRKVPHFHPEAKGRLLGSYSQKEIIDKYGRLYFRVEDSLHEKEKDYKLFFEAVGLALKEFNYALSNACADYMLEYNPNLKQQTAALQRLSKFFKSKGLHESTVDQKLLKKFLSNKEDVEKAANNDF